MVLISTRKVALAGTPFGLGLAVAVCRSPHRNLFGETFAVYGRTKLGLAWKANWGDAGRGNMVCMVMWTRDGVAVLVHDRYNKTCVFVDDIVSFGETRANARLRSESVGKWAQDPIREMLNEKKKAIKARPYGFSINYLREFAEKKKRKSGADPGRWVFPQTCYLGGYFHLLIPQGATKVLHTSVPRLLGLLRNSRRCLWSALLGVAR